MMSGMKYDSNPVYSYAPQCPYRATCPVRVRCPVCPHQQEQHHHWNAMGYNGAHSGSVGSINTGNYGNINGGIPHEWPMNSVQTAMQYVSPGCAGSGCVEYGYEKVYPMENTIPENKECDRVNEGYNTNGYISPNENICNPWDNNRMLEWTNPWLVSDYPYG